MLEVPNRLPESIRREFGLGGPGLTGESLRPAFTGANRLGLKKAWAFCP